MNKHKSCQFAIGAQGYYPGQAYNTPAMLQLAASINANQGRLLDIGCGDGQLLSKRKGRPTFPACPELAIEGTRLS